MKTNRALLVICSIAAYGFSCAAQSTDVTPKEKQIEHLERTKAQLELAVRVAPIKSRETLLAYLKMAPARNNPLSDLKPAAREIFLQSLTFNEKGLTGFNYAVLRDELSKQQVERVLSLFGYQHTTKTVKGELEIVSPTAVLVTDGSCNSLDCMGNGGFYYGSSTHYKDMLCSGRATCAPRNNFICIANNC